MKIVKLESEHWSQLPSGVAVDDIIAEVRRGGADAAKLLDVSESLNVIVLPNLTHVIDVTGTGASTYNAELIDVTFDPKRAADSKFLHHIYASMFHEFNHAARFKAGVKHDNHLDWWILEGLATVFEKKYAGAEPGWGAYDPKEARAWFDETQAMDEESIGSKFWYKHPDGRRWIGYRVGTWIVDEAIKNSDKDIIDLTVMPCKDILDLSKLL